MFQNDKNKYIPTDETQDRLKLQKREKHNRIVETARIEESRD